MPAYCNKNKLCTDVVIIGNGPSGICLSYMLSGYRPYYNGRPHSNPYLDDKLKKIGENQTLIEQDIEELCEGLEGRSGNPVAVLFDSLSHPEADMGVDNPSLLEWRYEPQHKKDHVVLGKMKPGGSWQRMEGSMQTLSLSSWMELPDMPFQDWIHKNKRNEDTMEPCTNRATINDVCNYYMSFVEEKNLKQNFHDNHTVTSVRKVYQSNTVVDNESGETEPCCPGMTKHPFYWEVRGYRMINCCLDDSRQEEVREEFCISAPTVVIATGTFDIPNKLGLAGENLPFVSHSLHEFESVINNERYTVDSDPVLVVGAGLSAADAVLMALDNGIPVMHVFRRGANDSSVILKKLPQNMYPEYHKVHSLMKGVDQNPLYKPLPMQDVIELKEDKKALLKPRRNKTSSEITSVDVSHAAVLIGSRPDLSFLSQEGRNIGVVQKYPIESKHNPIDIEPYSYQSVHEPGLYAMGPLVGDNFVRFGLGGAFGITHHLLVGNK